MTDPAVIDQIKQKKFDCLCTKYLHVRQLQTLNIRNMTVDFLAIGVPILYFVVRYYAKRTGFEILVESVWEAMAALLLALAVLKMAFHWQDHAERHSRLLGENIAVIVQADNLLMQTEEISPDGMRLFFQLAARSETADREALGIPSEIHRKAAYREGLKESKAECPRCGSSPWEFRSGSCQMCGNTPRPTSINPQRRLLQ